MIKDENLCRNAGILNSLYRDYTEINIYSVVETDPWWSFDYIKNNSSPFLVRKYLIKNAAYKED
jgi:hypothetical protein